MARIVGAIGTSHAPSIGAALDAGKHEDAHWKVFFDAYLPARAWLAEMRPDTVVIFANDHMNRFFFDAFPTFAISTAEHLPITDEGFGRRPYPDMVGDVDLGWHIARGLIADAFDPVVCQEYLTDHSVLTPIALLCDPPWPVKLVPIAVNAAQHPMPTPRRCLDLGRAVGRAVASYPSDDRVLIIGSGGLSHQTSGPRFGFVNPDWDNQFMTLLANEPETLADYHIEEFIALGGNESTENLNWMAMRGALSHAAREVHRGYHAPMVTGCGLLVLEEPK